MTSPGIAVTAGCSYDDTLTSTRGWHGVNPGPRAGVRAVAEPADTEQGGIS